MFRTGFQFAAVLLACLIGAWLLGWQTRSRPTIISGQVIDWSTGKPAAYTDVLGQYSAKVARTDANGQFSFVAPHEPNYYFLFAGSPRYGRLLQTFFGQTVVVYRGGEEIRNVVIPAIPATSLSGHVYDSDGRPVAGCDVSAVTRDNREADMSLDLRSTGVRSFSYEMPEDDDPNKFIEPEVETTDSRGEYVFGHLGADRYTLLARCREAAAIREAGPHLMWEPAVYPQATSIDAGREIVLLPGDKRSGIDFHLHQKQSFPLEVDVIFADHSVANSYSRYPLELHVFRTDRAITSESPGEETCDWAGNAEFRCGSLFPGTYTLYLDLSGGPFPRDQQTQFAKAIYTMRPSLTPQHVVVQLHKVPASVSINPPKGPSGFLDTGKVCETALDGTPAFFALAWGHGHAGGKCYLLRFWGDTRLPVPANNYKFIGFEDAFALHGSSGGRHSKVEALIGQQGVAAVVRAGQTIRPATKVMTTGEIISLALDSLRTEQK